MKHLSKKQGKNHIVIVGQATKEDKGRKYKKNSEKQLRKEIKVISGRDKL